MFLGLLYLQTARAQTDSIPARDSSLVVPVESPKSVQTDSLNRHIPAKATIFSAVLPGLGQAYNKKFWKIPIVYAGFIGLGITIDYYNQGFMGLKKSYYHLNDDNPNTNFHIEFLSGYGWDFSDRNIPQINETLEKGIEKSRRQRDLMIIVTAGFYLLNILDANVDAHFIDFDISEDLSLIVEPVLFDPLMQIPMLGSSMMFHF